MDSLTYSIFMAILASRKVTRKTLAEKFEVSRRTISRHVDRIIESGVPLISLQGMGGGYMLPDDYVLERDFLTDNEKKRMLSVLDATKENFSDKLNVKLIEKFTAMTKGGTYSNVYNMAAKNLVIDLGPHANASSYKNRLVVLNQAIDARKTVLIKYTDRYEAYSERYVNPYNLVLKQGVWYLYAWCKARKDYRLFKLSRIKFVHITDDEFEFRDDASAEEKVYQQYGFYEEVEVVLEFSSVILPQIEEWLGEESVYEKDLSYRAKAVLVGGTELISKILSFGSSVKVISPAQLKEEVLVECKRVLENV